MDGVEQPNTTREDERRTCANCHVLLDPLHTRRCKGCHVAAYCSDDCQKIDWKSRHRVLCQEMAKMKAQVTEEREVLLRNLKVLYPTASHVEIRNREDELFRTWFKTHIHTLRKAALVVLMREWTPDVLSNLPDLGGYLIILTPRPRPTLSGDPSNSFLLSHGELVPVVGENALRFKGIGLLEKLPNSLPLWEQRATQMGSLRRLIGAVSFVGAYHHFVFSGTAPLFAPTRESLALLRPNGLQPGQPNRQFPTSQAMILRGHVLGPPDVRPDSDADFKVGRMVEVGQEWKWQQLSEEENRNAGYLEFPGYVAGNF